MPSFPRFSGPASPWRPSGHHKVDWRFSCGHFGRQVNTNCTAVQSITGRRPLSWGAKNPLPQEWPSTSAKFYVRSKSDDLCKWKWKQEYRIYAWNLNAGILGNSVFDRIRGSEAPSTEAFDNPEDWLCRELHSALCQSLQQQTHDQ